jgi:beta-1,4-mannosyl-glycoprotein beta-1,4-N-acetylglucosaminyltransferase
MIYDCFSFFNEVDLLDLRLNYLKDYVDKFIIVESTRTHSGNVKPLNFDIANYQKFKGKIIHVVVDFPNEGNNDSWFNESYQRDAILQTLINHNASDDDLIYLSDLDEIFNYDTPFIITHDKAYRYIQGLYYFYLNNKNVEKWNQGTVAMRFGLFKTKTPTQWRLNRDYVSIENGGWHFSYLGGEDRIKYKLESFAHIELNNDDSKNEWICKSKNCEVTKELNKDLPRYIFDNIDKFKKYIKGNSVKTSIVIPSMTYELVSKCVESILKNTIINDIEIIVIANGMNPKHKGDLELMPIRCKWYDEGLGAVNAYNAGIREATGEYIVLLNDDCAILDSPKNQWLDMLMKPFSNPLVSCTGPSKLIPEMKDGKPLFGAHGTLALSEEDALYGFLVFFCVMIPRKMFNELGILDEQLKCGVDLDFCLKSKRAGYQIVQVPEEGKLDNTGHVIVGNFPIWHHGEQTVHSHYGVDVWHNIMKADEVILNERYGVKTIADVNEGIMYVNERNIIDPCWWVMQKKYELFGIQELLKNQMLKNILEVGTFEGGTALLWAHIASMYGGRVICSDINFSREKRYDPPQFKWAKDIITEIEGDSHAPEQIEKIRTHGPYDMIFIDGDHTQEGVGLDYINFFPMLKRGGYMVFHDIIDSEEHEKLNCFVGRFWNEMKKTHKVLEFIDNNTYGTLIPRTMGIGAIQKL